MNLDEYRALKAEQETEGAQADAQVDQGTTTVSQEVVQETTQEPTTPQAEVGETTTQEVPVELEAVIAERDRLAQEQQQLSQALKEAEEAKLWYNKINEDQEYAKAFAENNGLTYVDPQSKAVQELEQRYQSLLLERDIQNLSMKYDDFEPQTVIQTALDKGIKNLEDAYLLTKSQAQPQQAIDIEAIKEQIRQELQNELQSSVSTTSMIGAGAGVQSVQPTDIELSSAELKIAQNLGLSPKEYHTWKTRK